MPTEKQILGAQIRAAAEEYDLKHRRPYKGGYKIPTTRERNEFLAKLFGMPPLAVGYFMTYSRTCTHPWSAGACDQCP